MLVGIKEILVINIKEDQESFKCLLKDGQNFEIKINYQIQEKHEGLIQAFMIKKFLLVIILLLNMKVIAYLIDDKLKE